MLDRLSQSKLTTWLYCPGAFLQQYILGLESYNPNFEFGGDIHKQVENYHLGEPYEAEPIKVYTDIYPADFYGSPARVEERHVITLEHPITKQPHKLPFSLVMDGIRDGIGIYDLKTSAAAWNQKKADESLQATVYTYAWWQMTGELLPFTFIVVRKNPGPRTTPIMELTTTRTLDDFKAFWIMTERLIYDINTATEWPCRCRNQDHVIVGVNG